MKKAVLCFAIVCCMAKSISFAQERPDVYVQQGMQHHMGSIRDISVSRDGNFLALLALDGGYHSGEILVYDVATGRLLRELPAMDITDDFNAYLTFTEDGNFLLLMSDNSKMKKLHVQIVDRGGGSVVKNVDIPYEGLKEALSACKETYQTARQLMADKLNEYSYVGGYLMNPVYNSANVRCVLSAYGHVPYFSGRIRMGGQEIVFGNVRVVYLEKERMLKIRRLADGKDAAVKEVHSLPRPLITLDSRYVVAVVGGNGLDERRSLVIYDVDGDRENFVELNPVYYQNYLAQSFGRYLLSSAYMKYDGYINQENKNVLDDGSGIVVWDAQAGTFAGYFRSLHDKDLSRYAGTAKRDKNGDIYGIDGPVVSHTGKITAKSKEAHIELIDATSKKVLARCYYFTDGEWIVITPEGYYNASPNGDKHLNVRIGSSVYGIENYREAFFRPDTVKLALSGGSLRDLRKLADVKQPPVVTVVDTSASVAKDEATVTLRLTDSGGGIGDIRLFLNGTAVVLDSTRGVTIAPKVGTDLQKTYSLRLVNGMNSIRAIAFNSDNTMQSNDALFQITAAFKTAAKPSINALIVGINDYKNPKLQLKYAVSDANLFESTLKTVAAGLFEKTNIRKLIIAEETTSERIAKELRAFQNLNPDDLFVFFVASHGIVDDGEYFLITSNVGSTRTEKLRTDALSQTAIKELIANIPATKKLIVLDTCNAGALGDAIQTAMLTRGMSEDTAVKILSRAVGSTILSASTSVQEALEGYNGHGLFTYVLAEGLKGKADKGRTGYIKTTELADYVDTEVPALAEKVFKKAQYPTISISGQGFPVGKIQ